MRCLFFFFSPCLCDGRRGKALSQAISEHPASAVVRNLRWVHRVSIASVSRQWSTGSDAFISMSSAAGSPQHRGAATAAEPGGGGVWAPGNKPWSLNFSRCSQRWGWFFFFCSWLICIKVSILNWECSDF